MKSRNVETLLLTRLLTYISLPLLYDYHVKMPNFTFYGRRKQATTGFFFLLLNLSVVPKKSAPGKFTYI